MGRGRLAEARLLQPRWTGRTLTQGADVGRNIETGALKASSAPENTKNTRSGAPEGDFAPDSASAERPGRVFATANTESRRDRAVGAR